MNIKVDDQGAEREPSPGYYRDETTGLISGGLVTADVTGSMQRGLSYDPADMLGERVSVEHVGLPSPDAHAVAAESVHTIGVGFGPTPQDDRWLIWSNQHGMWWRCHGVGYTSQIEEAGRYSRTEAERHVADATVKGQLTYQRRDPITGREYVSVDEVAVPAPYGAAYLRRAPLDRVAEQNPDGVEAEPLSVQVSRILRRRSVGTVSHETAVKLVCAALSAALPVPAGALDVEAWGDSEADQDRAPTSAGYLEYLLDRIAAAVTR